MTALKCRQYCRFLSSFLTSCQTKNIISQYSKLGPSLGYQLISEHFGEICVILLQTVAK